MGKRGKMSAMEEQPNGPVVKKEKFKPKALSQDEALIKDIKIKMGICKRCTKELILYKKETANIIPSSISRLQQAYENLYALCDENEENAKVAGSPEYAEAKEIIAAAEACEEVVQ